MHNGLMLHGLFFAFQAYSNTICCGIAGAVPTAVIVPGEAASLLSYHTFNESLQLAPRYRLYFALQVSVPVHLQTKKARRCLQMLAFKGKPIVQVV